MFVQILQVIGLCSLSSVVVKCNLIISYLLPANVYLPIVERIQTSIKRLRIACNNA